MTIQTPVKLKRNANKDEPQIDSLLNSFRQKKTVLDLYQDSRENPFTKYFKEQYINNNKVSNQVMAKLKIESGRGILKNNKTEQRSISTVRPSF